MFLNKPNTASRPKIKVPRTSLDWVIDFTGFVFMVILVAIPLIFSKDLPERIPVHFNLAGEPDGYGTKLSLWILPLTGAVTYIGMTILELFPYLFNYPVEITPENALTQYRFGTRLIRILKTVIVLLFSFISYQTIKTALGTSSGLGKAFLPIFLSVTFGSIIVYFVVSLNNRHSDGRI
jgi:uncharacterized membrane protein